MRPALEFNVVSQKVEPMMHEKKSKKALDDISKASLDTADISFYHQVMRIALDMISLSIIAALTTPTAVSSIADLRSALGFANDLFLEVRS